MGVDRVAKSSPARKARKVSPDGPDRCRHEGEGDAMGLECFAYCRPSTPLWGNLKQ